MSVMVMLVGVVMCMWVLLLDVLVLLLCMGDGCVVMSVCMISVVNSVSIYVILYMLIIGVKLVNGLLICG